MKNIQYVTTNRCQQVEDLKQELRKVKTMCSDHDDDLIEAGEIIEKILLNQEEDAQQFKTLQRDIWGLRIACLAILLLTVYLYVFVR